MNYAVFVAVSGTDQVNTLRPAQVSTLEPEIDSGGAAPTVYHCPGSSIDTTFSHCNTHGAIDGEGCGTPVHSSSLVVRSFDGMEPGDGPPSQSWLVGPFNSTGGYDWWSVEFDVRVPASNHTWDGKFSLTAGGRTSRQALASRDDVGGFAFTFHEGAPSETGPPGANLGLPPFHNHHTVLGESDLEGAQFRTQGDSQCPGELDGFACQARDLASNGYRQILSSRDLKLSALLNDIRPAGSSPIGPPLGRPLSGTTDSTATAHAIPIALNHTQYVLYAPGTLGVILT